MLCAAASPARSCPTSLLPGFGQPPVGRASDGPFLWGRLPRVPGQEDPRVAELNRGTSLGLCVRRGVAERRGHSASACRSRGSSSGFETGKSPGGEAHPPPRPKPRCPPRSVPVASAWVVSTGRLASPCPALPAHAPALRPACAGDTGIPAPTELWLRRATAAPKAPSVTPEGFLSLFL